MRSRRNPPGLLPIDFMNNRVLGLVHPYASGSSAARQELRTTAWCVLRPFPRRASRRERRVVAVALGAWRIEKVLARRGERSA